MPSSDDRREEFVGDTHLGFDATGRHHVGEFLGRRLFTTEIARNPTGGQHEKSRSQHLDHRDQFGDGGGHRFEQPGITSLVRICHGQLGAPRLGIAFAHLPAYSHRTCRGRTGDHAAGPQYRNRTIRRQIHLCRRGDGRPIRTPDPEHPITHHNATGSEGASYELLWESTTSTSCTRSPQCITSSRVSAPANPRPCERTASETPPSRP